jgi:tight adherence protein B
VLMVRGAPLLLALFAGMFFGIGGPYYIIGKMIKRRINKFNSNFPDAIELMVRGLRSGLPITETLGIVAQEIGGPVGLEFRAVSDKMKIGRTMEAALQETADRLGTAEYQFVEITLAIQRETGGNLAEILDNLSYLIRERFKIMRQVRVYTAQGRLTMMLLMGLPPIIVVSMLLMNPAFIRPLFADPIGHTLIVAGLTLQTVGYFVIRRIIRIQV